MVLGPLLLLAGVLLRIREHFFFPQQMAAFEKDPLLMTASYSTFAAGNVLMWPAVAALAGLIAVKRPGWGVWGGTLAMFGLFARTFHAGIDHLAFQLVRVQNLETATRAVAASYGAFHIFQYVSFAILFGWIALAIGAWRSGTLVPARSVALALMSALMIGVLKGSTITSIIAVSGLSFALVPLGVQLLRGRVR